MRFRGPVDAHEPVALVLHRADPHAVGAAAMLTGPCTGAQGRRLPTGPPPRPLAGARVPPQVLEAQGVVGRSRQVGPIRTAYDKSIRITMRGTGGRRLSREERERASSLRQYLGVEVGVRRSAHDRKNGRTGELVSKITSRFWLRA